MHQQRLLGYLSLGLFLINPTLAYPQPDPNTLPSDQNDVINEDVIRNMVKDMKSFQKSLNELLSTPPLKPSKVDPITTQEIRGLVDDMREIKIRVSNLEDGLVGLTNNLGNAIGLPNAMPGKIASDESGKIQLRTGSQNLSIHLANELGKLQQQIAVLNTHLLTLQKTNR